MNDEEFLAAFEACALEEFHHRDHVKVAYLYLGRYSLDEAIVKVRAGLQALAVAGVRRSMTWRRVITRL